MSRTEPPPDEAMSRMVWPNGDIQLNVDGVELPSTATELLRGIFEDALTKDNNE